MSDFFNSNSPFTTVPEQKKSNFWEQQGAIAEQQQQERLENRQRYGVELSDAEYAQINNLIADSDNYDEEAHRIGSAILYSKKLNIPVEEAYLNLDAYNEALWGNSDKIKNQRSAFTAISDMFVIGTNSLKLGDLGNKLRVAEMSGDQEMVDVLTKQIEAIENDNTLRQDNAPRSWITEALKAGAQTLPFSGQAAGLGLFGNFIAPGLGTALAFGSSSSLAAGQEYIDMRREGVTPETASRVAAISGGIQGAIEVALGTTTDYLAAGAGKKVAETAAGKFAKKASEAFAKRFHYGAGKKAAVQLVTAWTTDKLGEGLEEAVQEITSIVGQDVARSMDGLGLSEETIADKTKQVMEAFKGGVVGAIVLGLPLDVVNTRANIKDFQNVKEAASTIGSEEMFEKAVENNPVFSEMKDEKKKEIIREVWENTQNEMEAAELHEARAQAEVNTADETFENIETDEESGETNAAPVVRDDLTGGLIVQDDITEDDGDIKKGSYRAGDNTKSEKNNYGYINYTIDEDNKTVTIDKFSMNAAREGLREELYDNFARDYAGYSIEWDPKLKIAKDVKERLVEANPSGKNNGLNYYNSKDEIANIQTRKEVAGQIREAYKAAGKTLTNEQVAADVAILESLYNRLGRDMKERGVNNFSDYVSYTFGNKLFGDQREAFEAAARQGEQGKVQGASVTRNLKEFDRGMKALIYVTENGDFSTFSHEVAHIARKQMSGTLLDEAAQAFNVEKDEDGNYNWTQQNEEDFAYGFEQFLRTGKAKNDGLKTLFQKLAQLLNDCMTALKSQINMSPEIEKVYNELLAGDKSVLAAAKRAAEQSDTEYAQQMEEETARAAEDKYKLEQEEREANAETTDYDEELEAPTVTQNDTEETEEAAPESQEEAIAQILDDAGIPDNMKEEAADILNDPEETIGAKEEVIQDVAAEAASRVAESNFDWLTGEVEENTEDDFELELDDNIFDMFEADTDENTEADKDIISQEEIDALLNGIDPDMLFQTSKNWTERDNEARDIIKNLSFYTAEESKRILDNFDRLYMTPWHKQAIESVLIRADMQQLLAGEEMTHESKLGAPTASEVAEAIRGGAKSIEKYLKSTGLIGSTTKAGNVVNSSFINCDPSEECAKYCYAAKGNYAFPAPAVKSELVSWFIENNPELAAKITADEYMPMLEYEAGKALRLFDKGDISESWLKYIETLNKKGIKTQIFSKRPDILRRVDRNNNVIMLSIDKSNLAMADDPANMDLPIAFVYSGREDLQFIENHKDRFLKSGGSILPVKVGDRLLDHSEIEALPLWARPFCCPVDSGHVVLQDSLNEENKPVWSCGRCNTAGGVGCFYHRVTAVRAQLAKFDDTPLSERDYGGINEQIKELEKLAEGLGNRDLIRAELAQLISKIRTGVNIEAEAGSVEQAGSLLRSESGNGEKTQEEKRPKLSFQTAASIESDNFKKWFGDWENDPANASKVVDENGKPQVMYHGTVSDFDTFDSNTAGARWNNKDKGFFFTDAKDEAEIYTNDATGNKTGRVIESYLNIKKPLIINDEWAERNEAHVKSMATFNPTEYFDEYKENYIYPEYEAGDYDGIIVDNGYGKTVIVFSPAQIKSANKNNGNYDPNNPNMLFQTAYHGTAADFDKFDTERYGLSGEGSMAFGYGTYLSGSEAIARDYAERQGMHAYDKMSDNYYGQDVAHLLDFTRKGMSFEEAKQKVIEDHDKNIAKYELVYGKGHSSVANSYYDKINFVNSLTEEDLHNRKLLTVEIPDNGFLQWDKNTDYSIVEAARDRLYNYLIENDEDGSYEGNAKDYLKKELEYTFNAQMTGQNLYQTLTSYLNSERTTSKFLNEMGVAGMEYPAGTNFGTPDGEEARNFVIYNDDDAQIIEKLSFQTQQELYDDARSFATWQEFMDFYQNDFDPVALEDPTYHNQVPSDASAQWYQTTWELANGIRPEESLNEEEVKDKYAKEGTEPRAMDSLFVAEISGENGKFEDFMHMVAYYENINLDSPEWNNITDAEEAAERDRIDQLKDLIEVTMKSESMQRAINRIAAGGEITPGFKTRLISEMSDPFKSRDFRALYAEVMDDATYKVNPEDSTATLLENKLNDVNRRFNLQIPAVDVSRMSPQQRKELSNKLDNEEIAAKLKDGSLKMDDQVDKYIKSLTSQINELKRQQNELKKSILEETSRLADEEQRDLLKVNEELIKAKAAYDKKNDEITRKIAKGIKISSKYQKEAQNLKHDYNEILRKYKDLLATTKITGEVQRALDTQQRLGDALNNIDKLEEERTTMADVQKLRKNLVKRTMRRVKFDTVDYENARKIIAIQRIFEPNLLGGVNKWIGQRDPYLRGVISAVITDKDYRNELSNYIRDRATSSNAYSEFWAKWQDLITAPTAEEALKKFNSWDEKTRKRAALYLPKEDWIKELQLKELEKEREESIDLDIGIKERREPMRNEKGELVYKPQYDENGKLIKNPDRQEAYYKTIYEFDASEEIKAMIRDTVGEDIFNNLLYRPFSEWTVEEMEQLAKRVDDLYTEGRDILAARKQLQIERAAAIRQKIEKAVKDTGIVINDDDTPEEKAKKQAKIDKILGLNSELKGTNASKDTGFKSRLNRLLHGYVDANILRVARILDGNTEGVNVQELYRKEDDCYNSKTRSINSRVNKINKVMQENNITMDELSQAVKVGNKTFTVDELLFFAAANEDYVEDSAKIAKGFMGIDANDDYAATSRNAVMFGNLFSDTASTEFKEECAREDEEMQRRIDADELTAAERNAQILGELVTRPGTARYIQRCHETFVDIIAAANQLDDKFKALLKVIADDYAEQYDRMNEISIKEFNTPVHRVKCYVPLVRLESNGDTNVNQVKEDLLAALGQGASKEWVNKGMTKRRTNMSPLHQKPVQTGLYKTWADSVDRTEHFISYSGYVRELNRVYKSRDAQYTRQFIENRYGKGMVTYIDDYINEVANPNANKIREKGAELLHTLRGKTAPAYLAWKASAIIKQGLTSPWPYMQFINPAEYAAASWKCITSRGAMYDAIRQKSVFMNNRVMDPMNDLIDEMAEKSNQNKFDKALNKFNKKGMAGLEWIDWVCVAPGWYACYEKKYNELVGKNQDVYETTKERLQEENYYAEVGTTAWKTPEQIEKLAQKAMEDDVENKAVQYADDCTRACQPSNRAADISPLFKNSSEAMKAYLQFQTSLNVIWQNIRYDIPYAIKKNKFNRVAMTIVGYALAGIFMNSVMEGIGGDDDEYGSKADDRLKNLVYYATTQFTDSVPMIGSELTNTMDKLITGKQQYMNTGTDMTPTATKFFSILTNAKKGNWEKAAEMTAEGIAMYLGLPVSGTKEIKKLAGVGDGDGKIGLNLGNVYGILDPEDYK